MRHLPATIGRSRQRTIRIEDESISRLHARLEADGSGGYTVTDLGSVNGTQVNSVRSAAQQATPVRIGDAVTLGSCLLVIREASPLRPASTPALVGRVVLQARLDELVRDAARTGLGFAVLLIAGRHFVRRFSELGDAMRIYTDGAAFDEALRTSAVQ